MAMSLAIVLDIEIRRISQLQWQKSNDPFGFFWFDLFMFGPSLIVPGRHISVGRSSCPMDDR